MQLITKTGHICKTSNQTVALIEMHIVRLLNKVLNLSFFFHQVNNNPKKYLPFAL